MNWDLNNPNDWQGVEWTYNGKIKKIDLQNKNLVGILDLSNIDTLEYLNIQGNKITAINLTGCVKLKFVNCSYNDFSKNGLDLSTNTNLEILKCDACNLKTLNISQNPKLINLSCTFNCLETLSLDNNLKLNELFCCYNYLDVSENSKLYNKLLELKFDNNCYVSDYPQSIPSDAVFNTEEINSLKSFASFYDNNISLNWINDDDSVNLDNVLSNVVFEKFGNEYRVTGIDISNISLSGYFNCNAFTELKEFYCSNTKLNNLDFNLCLKLTILHCDNCNISNLVLPSNANNKTTPLYKVNCENNHIDLNIFNKSVVKYIKFKAGSELNISHQYIDGDITLFDENDYNLICELKNNNAELDWNLNMPGHIQDLDWVFNSNSGKYHLYRINMDFKNIKGDIDLSKCHNLTMYSFIGTNISTISLPTIDIEGDTFSDCHYLESVIMGCDGSTQSNNENNIIESYAFDNCDSLQAVYIPQSVKIIEKDAFQNCPNLTIAGVQESFAQTWATENNIPFKAGYFICGNVAVRENCETDNIYNYPLQYAEVKIDNNVVATTDENGYYVIFELGNGKLNYDIDYIYGWTVRLQSEINDSSMIVTNPVSMVTFDMDQNGILNTIDIAMFTHYQQSIPTENHKYLDMNNDGVIDDKDAQIFDGLFMYKEPPTITSLPMQSMSAFRIAPQSVYEHKGIDVLPPIIE